MPLVGNRRRRHADLVMEVTLYGRPGCEVSLRMREILRDMGVAFDEREGDEAAVVVDGVVIPATQRAQIEQAIGWVGC